VEIAMKIQKDLIWGVTAMGIYVVGGIVTFSAIAMVGLLSGKDVAGWGDGRSLGYLMLCLGFFLSIMGVLLMRIFRNRSGIHMVRASRKARV
jgi:hypothetical protein